ncbi:copper ion binding protein [Caminicella sporogenes DSM 14501]|uniref:Copper chaperone CopZ n=1 Tax=Caminicella sporogenes DSM 14501 TaxID=1121266 RepID=A0A1M6TTV9_9FIRM|nr:heavy metal-associated domain-containing protein [Caminicella sporogenes]SHK60356.1 copper ion binding protein [Caminicella sporogenes DSM 14501]
MEIEKSFKIEGMTCAACAKAVERAVSKLEGVFEARVNLATEKMIVKYDKDKIAENNIIEAVKKSGYRALTDEDLKEVIIPIQGMT